MTVLNPAWVGRYSCPACPLAFRTLTDKKHHLKAEHPKPVKR